MKAIVLERVSPNSAWAEVAQFDDPIAASNYCIYRRSIASNPNFQCMFRVK